jgi:MoaA/NifB/PqqE/SkfB family radical SAM enzyme
MINVTGRCNSRCVYCRAWRDGDKQGEPSREELLDLVDQVATLGCHAVGFSGGEPLLRNDLEEVIARAAGHGLTVNIVTNGLLLTGNRLRSLAEAGLGSLGVSLDTLDPEAYEAIRGVPLKRVLDNLVHGASLEILPMGISTTVTSRNVDALAGLVEFAREKGLLIGFQLYEESVHLANVEDGLLPGADRLDAAVKELLALKTGGTPISSSDEYLKSMVSYVRSREWVGVPRCLAPVTELCVDETLQVHTCWGTDVVVGDAREQSLAEIWRSRAFDIKRKELADCRECLLSCHFDNSLRMLASQRGGG